MTPRLPQKESLAQGHPAGEGGGEHHAQKRTPRPLLWAQVLSLTPGKPSVGRAAAVRLLLVSLSDGGNAETSKLYIVY